jgi:hypothetical protein
MSKPTPEEIQAAANLGMTIEVFLQRKERWGNPDNFTFTPSSKSSSHFTSEEISSLLNEQADDANEEE